MGGACRSRCCSLARPAPGVGPVRKEDDRAGPDVRLVEEFQRGAHGVVDVRAVGELRLPGERGLDRSAVSGEVQEHVRAYVERDHGELFLPRPLAREGAGRGHRAVDRPPLHAVARVDHEHDSELAHGAAAGGR